jgi:hypothetical protein
METHRHERTVFIFRLCSLCRGFIATNALDVIESIRMIRFVVGDVKFAH